MASGSATVDKSNRGASSLPIDQLCCTNTCWRVCGNHNSAAHPVAHASVTTTIRRNHRSSMVRSAHNKAAVTLCDSRSFCCSSSTRRPRCSTRREDRRSRAVCRTLIAAPRCSACCTPGGGDCASRTVEYDVTVVCSSQKRSDNRAMTLRYNDACRQRAL